jgi:hypothetical protein
VKRHSFHPEAEQEYADAANYYFRINPELAGRFYDEIERLILEVRKQPDRFRLFDTPARRHFSNVFRTRFFISIGPTGYGSLQ